MALHIVLGYGEMSRKELTETLKDLWERAGDEPYWFVVQGKSDPTDTDAILMKWMHTNEIYYDVLTDDEDAMADIYGSRQATHVAKRLPQQVVKLLNTLPEETDSSADVLALFASDDPKAPEDGWLNDVIRQVLDAGFPVLALNDGLTDVDLDPPEEGGTAEQEEETVAPTPQKTAAKKVASKKIAAPPKATGTHTREQLEEMELPELKEIAAGLGIELAPRTRMSTYIDAILGEGRAEAPSVEITAPPVTTTSSTYSTAGDVDIDVLADKVAALIIERLVSALQA